MTGPGGGPPRRRVAAHDGGRSPSPTWWGAFRRAHPGRAGAPGRAERPGGGGRRRPLRSGRGRASPRRARPTRDLREHPFVVQELLAVSPPGAATGARPLPLRSLEGQPLVLSPPGASLRAVVDGGGGRGGVHAHRRGGDRAARRARPAGAGRRGHHVPPRRAGPLRGGRSAPWSGAPNRRSAARSCSSTAPAGPLAPPPARFLAARPACEPESIRPPAPEELERLREIEVVAGRAFVDVGMPEIASDEPLPLPALEAYRAAGRTWVVGGRGPGGRVRPRRRRRRPRPRRAGERRPGLRRSGASAATSSTTSPGGPEPGRRRRHPHHLPRRPLERAVLRALRVPAARRPTSGAPSCVALMAEEAAHGLDPAGSRVAMQLDLAVPDLVQSSP